MFQASGQDSPLCSTARVEQAANLKVMCNRGEALLLCLKNGNACGLQATPCHADAAVADPVLQHHKHW